MGEIDLQAQRATKSTQFFYGFGSIAVGIKNNLLGTFLLIYYNQVLGLDAITVSFAFSMRVSLFEITEKSQSTKFPYLSVVLFALNSKCT